MITDPELGNSTMSTEKYLTVTVVLAALRGHCGVPVVLYRDRSEEFVLDERLSRAEILDVLNDALQRGGIEEIRVAPARDRYCETLLLDVLDYKRAEFGVSADVGDWPLGLSGCVDFSAARKGPSTWRYDYPSSWTDEDVYAFQHGLDELREGALDRFDDCAAVSAALIAGQFDFARTLLQRSENEHARKEE